MTHKDIYTKFMIEYDKANITSSYPSLTEYEIATLLDKAYLALIAQKITGNNTRKAGFEADVKALEDLRPLVGTDILYNYTNPNFIISKNESVFRMNNDPALLYYISSYIKYDNHVLKVQLITHEQADKFRVTDYNKPWIKIPVAFIEQDQFRVLSQEQLPTEAAVYMTYIKVPNKFIQDDNTTFEDSYVFELSDTMAEELINLAIVMALETVESTRLQTKVQTMQLES